MANLFERIDNRIMAAKIEQGMDMLKNKSTEELAQKIAKMDRNEVLKKLDEIDAKKVKEMNLDIEKIKSKITPQDLEKIKQLAGKDADKIMGKINELLYNNKGK